MIERKPCEKNRAKAGRECFMCGVIAWTANNPINRRAHK